MDVRGVHDDETKEVVFGAYWLVFGIFLGALPLAACSFKT